MKKYIMFIIAYDFGDKLKEKYYKEPECDLMYDKVELLVNEFIKSEYNKDTLPLYECIEKYMIDKLKTK